MLLWEYLTCQVVLNYAFRIDLLFFPDGKSKFFTFFTKSKVLFLYFCWSFWEVRIKVLLHWSIFIVDWKREYSIDWFFLSLQLFVTKLPCSAMYALIQVVWSNDVWNFNLKSILTLRFSHPLLYSFMLDLTSRIEFECFESSKIEFSFRLIEFLWLLNVVWQAQLILFVSASLAVLCA